MATATQGDTVWLKVVFRDRDGVATDPDPGSVTLRTYDGTTSTAKSLDGPFELNEATHRIDVGTYEYPYLIPLGKAKIVYEFSGTVSGRVELRRASFDAAFVV